MTVSATVLLIADNDALQAEEKVWGTGGWLPPEKREALDWLTFCRVSGWGVVISQPEVESMPIELPEECQWVIVACDPAKIGADLVAYFQGLLIEQPINIVVRCTTSEHPISELADTYITGDRATGEIVLNTGSQSQIRGGRTKVCAWPLDYGSSAMPWAFVNEVPVITQRKLGQGGIITLGFHPSAARDESGSATALLRHLLVEACQSPVVWLDFSGTMVLRMDDPGTAQNVYKRSWSYPELNETQWLNIGNILSKHDARLSIGYASGWVDDGESNRGALLVDGQAVERTPGRVHDAPRVQYSDKSGTLPGTVHDFEGEYRAICALRNQEVVDIELHGYTHMYPDSEKWASADDRYETTHWYRELGRHALPALARMPRAKHPIVRGAAAHERFFSTPPTTLISPGDEWTNEALEIALSEGLCLVSSYYLAIRHDDHFCWSQHICAPYLDEPSMKWFCSNLPVVGYFHDREPSIYGPKWVDECLIEWIKVGATTFISFRDLAFMLDLDLSATWTGEILVVSLRGGAIPAISTPLRLRVQIPKFVNNFAVRADYEGAICAVGVQNVDETTICLNVVLPKTSLPFEE
jgi:hypothetical protein